MKTLAMNEREFGRFIRLKLDANKESVRPEAAARLQAARQNALAHYRHSVSAEFSLAATGAGVINWWGGSFRPFLLAASLAVVIAGGNYVMTANRLAELEELDTALLTDELPISAYLDNGFNTWLADPSPR